MGDENHKVPLVENTDVRVLPETEASLGPDDKADYPLAGTNSIYSAILSRNETVKDAKRLKTFLELRDKYVKKKVLFEDPLFLADDSSLFYSRKSSMKFEWKRPSVSVCLLSSYPLHSISGPNMFRKAPLECRCVSHHFLRNRWLRCQVDMVVSLLVHSCKLSPPTITDS